MSEQKHAAEVLATMRQRFTSLNEIPVTQARITADEFAVLEAERDAVVSHQAGALGLVASIRWALGDNGRRMQDELIAWCRTLRTAEQERDALRTDFRRLNEKHTNLHMNADACRKERDALQAEVEALRAERDQATAAEREACAKVCEDISDEYQRRECMQYPELKTDAQEGASKCAAAISARGKA